MVDVCDTSMKMLVAALEKEEKGKAFYKQAASTCANDHCKEIFNGLMADEGVHMTRIRKLHAALSKGETWTGDWKACKIESEDLRKLFRERTGQMETKVKPDTTDLEAVTVGIDMEQGSIRFYSEQQAKATDALEKEFATQMVAEKNKHI